MLDDIIRRLTGAKVGRTTKQVQLTESEIRQLCVSSKEIFLSQPNLLELEAPIKICGKEFFYFFIFMLYLFIYFVVVVVVIEWLIWFEWLVKLKRLFVFNFRSKFM